MQTVTNGTVTSSPFQDQLLLIRIFVGRHLDVDRNFLNATGAGCHFLGHLGSRSLNVDPSISREEIDRCVEDIPWGIQLGFGFEELGVPHGGQVIVLNPLDDRAWDWNPYAQRRQMAAR